MTGWTAVLVACALCFALKLAGYLVPEGFLAGERVRRIAALITVALLSALVVVQALGEDGSLTVDARVPALGVAAVALWLRAPFIVVVVLAALTAAGLRAAT
ncbi:MAG TPA: AzlD domain-containing protein [Actinomycetales bacterium]|nr:AzlD domain-containing protein [Actinomycetales bacterium]